jgi:hypothetical protein
MQAGASFNIDDLKAKIEQAIASSKAQGKATRPLTNDGRIRAVITAVFKRSFLH